MTPHCTLGLTPHSGWAALVAVSGEPSAPRVLLRERVEMADAKLAGSKQPYHFVEELPVKEAARRLARLGESARAMATASLSGVVERLRREGTAPSALGILDSAGRKGGSLEAILASHALIHTADGDHFRDALAAAAAECGLEVARVRERDLLDMAASVLRRPAAQLQDVVQALGKPWGPPWTADQKQATLLAWLLLAGGGGRRGRKKGPR
jgi:hypothetical protein